MTRHQGRRRLAAVRVARLVVYSAVDANASAALLVDHAVRRSSNKIKQVDRARFVVGMEEQLLIAGQARHAQTAKRALVERGWRPKRAPALA